jgi:hypothetical protein
MLTAFPTPGKDEYRRQNCCRISIFPGARKLPPILI